MGGEEGLGVTTGQPNLYKQDLSKLDVSKLTALSREVISRQATINIGTIGHVAHGKSTIVKAISGVQTVRFKNELERNITIKLDARADDSTTGERMDTTDDTSKMPSSTQKRPGSPKSTQPIVKQMKLDELKERLKSSAQDDKENTSSNNQFKAEQLNHTSIENNSTGTHTQQSEITDEDVRLKKSFESMKLKELRIVLEDIKDHEQESEGMFWEVERILSKKVHNGVTKYLIKWKNWNSGYNTWEPVANLLNCSSLLKSFERERVAILEEFKERMNFYPNMHDIQEFLREIREKGEKIDCDPVNEELLLSDIKYFSKQSYAKHSKRVKTIKQNILRILLCETRRDQLESLRDWENEINSITKGRPEIQVENSEDLEGAPQDFFYIDAYLPGAGVTLPEDPPIGCECYTCETKSKCCFRQTNNSLPYTSASRIRVPPGTPIYECNKRCKCGMDCPNRVVQRGTDLKFCIFRTENGRGWGVKTLRSIKKGTFVTEYVGEVITSEEAEKRGKKYDAAGRTYLFDLDYNETEEECPYTVDAGMYGNISHFINHSCDPNLAVYGVWINCLDPNLPNLAFFATRDIRQNEEMTFDYMCQSRNEKLMQEKDTASLAGSNTADKNSSSALMINKTICKCGASSCRRYLF